MYSEDSKTILDRMLANIPSNIDKTEGYLVYDALAPISKELSQCKANLDGVLNKVFAQTSSGEYLEKRCVEFGIYRKDGTKATGQVTFTGSNGVLIPIGTTIQTLGGLQFKTLADVTITNNTVIANIEASNIGNAYNLPSSTIIQLPVQIVGVTSVNNANPTTGGTNIETDTELLSRLLLKVQTPATSGNMGHYKLWATEVNGVGDAIVIPTWNGPGTVKVIILDSNKHTPTKTIIDNVIANIESYRPIGATVTVQGAIEVPININATLQLASGADINTVKTQIENSVKPYLETLAFKDPLVRYTRIANVLLDIPPIIDYSGLTVNGGTANIEILQGSVAVLGSVVIISA